MKKHQLIAKIVVIWTLAIFILSTVLTAVMYLGQSGSASTDTTGDVQETSTWALSLTGN